MSKMTVLRIIQWLLLAILLKHQDEVAGQFIAAPPTCPGDTFTFICTVTGEMNGITIWRVGRGSSECSLTHRSTSDDTCGTNDAFIATPHTGFARNASSFLSTLSGTGNLTLNGTLIECFGPANNLDLGNMVGSSILQIIGPPIVVISGHELSDRAVKVTVSWTLSGGDSADFYLINITTNAPQTPYGGLLNITTAIATQHELTGFMADYEYNITVHGVNCGSQEGRESEPLTIRLEVPAVPSSCNITLLYNQSSRKLLLINNTWNTVPDPVDPIPDISGDITQYQISFLTVSTVATENVNIARCTGGRCSHTFEPPSNPPSSYDSVSVAAENVVGVGAARMCTTQPINSTNNYLTGEVADVSSSNDVTLNCTFLPGFTGSAHCTVQYGTDPTYMHLPYSAESTETGTAGDTVSVVLRERLNSSTVYYYTVSAVSGDVTVTALAPPFRTNCFLNELWDLPAVDANFLSDVKLLNDSADHYPSCNGDSAGSIVLVNTTLNTATVAYYSGTTAGSRACFVCDEDNEYTSNEFDQHPIAPERVCQSDGTWSGSPIICVCRLPPWTIALIVIGAIANVINIVDVVPVIVHDLRVCYLKGGKTVWWWTTVNVIDVLLCAAGLVFGITMVVFMLIPPNGNACEPSWRSTRDRLFISGCFFSIVAFIFTNFVIWFHICWHREYIKNHKRKKCLLYLLLVAIILTVIGVGLWIAMAVLIYIHPKPEKRRCLQCCGDKKQDGSEANNELQEVTKSEQAERPGGEETSKQSEQNKQFSADDTVQEDAAPPPRPSKTQQHTVSPKKPLNLREESSSLDVNQKIREGSEEGTPLHRAATQGNLDTVKYLVKEGADINMKINDERSNTPIHMAAEKGHVDIVRYLFTKGADIHIKNVLGRTPLHVAAGAGHVDTVEYLVNSGADVNIKDHDGRAPLNLATEMGRVNIAEYLKTKI